MDFDTLHLISNFVHYVAFPLAVLALWLETLVGFFDSQIPEEYR